MSEESRPTQEIISYPPEKERELIQRTEDMIQFLKDRRRRHLFLGFGIWGAVIAFYALIVASGIRGKALDGYAGLAMGAAGAVGMFCIIHPWHIANSAIRVTRKGLEEFRNHQYKGDYENNFIGQAESVMYGRDFPFFIKLS